MVGTGYGFEEGRSAGFAVGAEYSDAWYESISDARANISKLA